MQENGLALFWYRRDGEGGNRMTYSSISIVAPDTVEQGKIVDAAVHVTNTTANYYPFRVKIYAVRDIHAVPAPSELIDSFEQAIEGGETKHYGTIFTMPAWDITILVMVYVFTDSVWDFDTHATKVVSLGTAPPSKYTDIVEIIVPVSASFGDTVNVEVRARNLYTDAITITVTGSYNGITLSFSPGSDRVPTGEVRSYSASFVMPNNDVTVNVGTFFWGVDEEWHLDDTDTIDIALGAVYAGKIIDKEMEFSGSGDGKVPVANVPIGVKAKLHVWGKNNMSTSRGMGIHWTIIDPGGLIAEVYEDWGGTIGAGKDHEFISSGQFDLNKAGKYTVSIELTMGEQHSPVEVDTYIGDLCTVAPGLEPSITDFAIVDYNKL